MFDIKWLIGKGNGMDTLVGKVSATIGVGVGFLFGGWTEMLTILAVVQGLDILSGFLKQLKLQSLSSREMFEGLLKKFSVWIVIVLAHMIDLILFDHTLLVTGAALAYVANEGLSVAENLGEMDVIVPASVLKYLKQVREKSEVDKVEEKEGV